MTTALLSGHGIGYEGDTCTLPKGVKVKFIVREGIPLPDSTGKKIENNPNVINTDKSMVVNIFGSNFKTSPCPDYYLADGFIDQAPLDISAPPNGFVMFTPDTRKCHKLSDIVAYLLTRPGVNTPLEVIWCACRDQKKSKSEVTKILKSLSITPG